MFSAAYKTRTKHWVTSLFKGAIRRYNYHNPNLMSLYSATDVILFLHSLRGGNAILNGHAATLKLYIKSSASLSKVLISPHSSRINGTQGLFPLMNKSLTEVHYLRNFYVGILCVLVPLYVRDLQD